MKSFVRCFALLALIAVAGCESIQQGQSIPVPSTTPFDRSPMTRMAYLEAYRDGYRAVANGTVGSVELIQGPYPLVREMGFRAGAAAARSAQAIPNSEKLPR